ncbi:MAG: lipopolysaccharide biosynthesis protein [Rikenellaceae bacterium]
MTGDSLKARGLEGMFWSGVERLLGQVVTFVITLILARLVTPADYGLLAIVMVFVNIAGVMVDGGFANALVREVECTDRDRSTVLYFNIVVAMIIYLVLYLVAPLLADLYDKGDVVDLVRVASIIVVINSLAVVQHSILISAVDFKRQGVISLVSSIVSGVVGVALAYLGFGVWALIVQAILSATVRVIMLWVVVAWRPLLCFSRSSFERLFGYSSKLMLSNLIVSGGNELFQLLIGRLFSTANLGFYNYTRRMASFLSCNITITIQRVLFPILSQIQNDEVRLSQLFRRSQILTMSLIAPLMFALSAIAEPVVRVLLTEEWYAAIPILRVISITLAIYPLLLLNINILYVKRRSDLSLKVESMSIAVNFVIISLLQRHSLIVLCVALCVKEFLNFILYASIVGRVNSYNLMRQLVDILPILLQSIVSMFVVRYMLLPLIDGAMLQIVVGSVATFALYFAMVALRRGYDYRVIINILEEVRRWRR